MTFLSGRKSWPSKDDMQRNTIIDMQKRWDKGYKKRQAHMMGTDQVIFLQFFVYLQFN